jgi:hypothetical protein
MKVEVMLFFVDLDEFEKGCPFCQRSPCSCGSRASSRMRMDKMEYCWSKTLECNTFGTKTHETAYWGPPEQEG